MISASMVPQKKKYAAPRVNDLCLEEAKLVLLDQAARGDQNAKDLLNSLKQTSGGLAYPLSRGKNAHPTPATFVEPKIVG